MEKKSVIKRIIGAAIMLLFSIAAAVLCLYLCFFGRNREPISLADIGDPKNVVESYFEALSNSDFEQCEKYLMDFSVAGMSDEADSELAKAMREMLTESYEYELLGESEIVGKNADVKVRVTYVDLSKIGAAMKIKANEIAENKNYHGGDIFSEESAMTIAMEAYNAIECSASDFLISNDIEIMLTFDGCHWKMLYSEALENMLFGKK